jgi:Coenzyme PQQ synthesis protein D (PqqD)
MGCLTAVGDITTKSIVQASKDAVWCELSGEAAILNLRSSMYHGLNPTGTKAWELLAEPRTVAEIRDALLEEYDVQTEQCERDVIGLLQELLAQGLITVEDA